MKYLTFAFSFALFLFFSSCGGEFSEEETGKPRKAAVGDLSEVIIVGPKEALKGQIGDTLMKFFKSPFPHLPQAEQSFDARFVFSEGFGTYEQGQAHIISLSLGDKEQNRAGRVTIIEDMYAHGQTVYTIYALNQEAFFKVFRENKEAILNDLNKRVVQKAVGQADYAKNVGTSSKVKSKFGFNISLPEGFYLATENENVLSFKRSRETSYKYADNSIRSHNIIDGVVVYRYDHLSDDTFSLEKQIEQRNSFLGQTVISELDMPMKVEMDERFIPQIEEIGLDGNYATKMRGLWRFDRPLKGGPFVSVSFFDNQKKYAISVDAYVFAPKFDKRDYIRELEGILHSITFDQTTES